jgi:hypothetical protein
MAQNTAFQHVGLPSPRTIRCLKLHPADDVVYDISCTLYFNDLDYPQNLEALSYSWGADPPSHPIICHQDGSTAADNLLNVTYNCLAGLRQLRWCDKPRHLWIDSICIDQTNVKERNQQVALMGELYPSAKHVIVWVGEQDNGTERAMDFITRFSEGVIMLDGSPLKPKDELMALLLERRSTLKATPDPGMFTI